MQPYHERMLKDLESAFREACAGMSPLEGTLWMAEQMRSVYGDVIKIEARADGGFVISNTDWE